MTIMHVAQPVDAGVAAVVGQLAAGQRSRGDTVVVACPPRGRLPALAREAGADVSAWEASRSPGPDLAAEVRALRRVVAAVEPDVLHLHSSKAGLAGRIAVRGRRATVFEPHAWSFAAVTGAMARASAVWERFGARWTHRFVCVSDAERAEGEAAGVRAAYTVIRNGVDLDYFAPGDSPDPDEPGPVVAREGSDSRVDARKALGLEPDAPLAVCVGRLSRQKGQDVLLAAWPTITRRVPGARLALVGDGPDRAALEAAAPPETRFTGNVDDPRLWYRAADVVVLPSRWEGMALVPLEAMACARPVILTDVPGARESLPPADIPAALVPRDDPDALADALTALLANRSACAAAGARARTHMRERHDVRRVVDAMADVYGEAIDAWHRARR